MQKTVKQKGVTQKFRKKPKGGKAQHNAVCSRSDRKKDTAIIGDSIFTVKFTPKSGAYVFLQMEVYNRDSSQITDQDYAQLHADLCSNWKLYKKLTGQKAFDVSRYNSSLPSAILSYIIDDLGKSLPEGWQFNIERIKEKFRFVIYKSADYHYSWNYIPVKRLLKKLAHDNPVLHELMLSFLKLLNNKGVSLWHNGFAGMALESYGDSELENLHIEAVECDDKEMLDSYYKAKKKYAEYTKGGEAFYYARKILNAADYTIDEMKEALSGFRMTRKQKNILQWMMKGCELLDNNYSIGHYSYDADGTHDDATFLTVEDIYAIVWDDKDIVFDFIEDMINCYAQEGIEDHYCWFIVTPKTQIDFTRLEKEAIWPLNFGEFINDAIPAIKKYLYE